jgi:hypothetical protein
LESGNAPDVIDARDGQRDVVDCGEDGDLAIVDKRDAVRNNCETIDAGGKRRLVVGRWGLVRPTSSGFGLRLPAGNRLFPLKETVKIPLRSTIDPGAGGVRLGVATKDARAPQWISARGGLFRVRQKTGRPLVTELRLSGPAPGPCTTSSASRAAAPAQAPRRLLTRIENGKKRKNKKNKKNEAEWWVSGKYSDGAAKGTEWLTEDRCDGTLTTVMSGTVRVRNLARHRTVIVRAGHSYLARPR